MPALTRFLRHRAGVDAEDLLQNTLLACIETRASFRGDASFRTYMFTIARHELQALFRARTRLRRQVDVEGVVLIDPSRSAEEGAAAQQLHSALRSALLRLRPEDFALLRQVYIDESDSCQLASQHSIKPSSVRARLHRARRTLAQHARDLM